MGRLDRVLAGGARALALAGLVVLSACAGSVAAPVAMPVATPDPAPAAPSRQMSPLGRLPAGISSCSASIASRGRPNRESRATYTSAGAVPCSS